MSVANNYYTKTHHQTFDVSNLIPGQNRKWKETHEDQNEIFEFSFQVERVDKYEYMGLAIGLTTAYMCNRGDRFKGMFLLMESKGEEPDRLIHHWFGKKTKWVLMYNEWKHLEFGNLGDFLHNMTSFKVKWRLFNSFDEYKLVL